MYFDGSNLEAQSLEEANRLIEALKGLGELNVSEDEGSSTIISVKDLTFVMQNGAMNFPSLSAEDDKGAETLFRLYLECGGSPDEFVVEAE